MRQPFGGAKPRPPKLVLPLVSRQEPDEHRLCRTLRHVLDLLRDEVVCDRVDDTDTLKFSPDVLQQPRDDPLAELIAQQALKGRLYVRQNRIGVACDSAKPGISSHHARRPPPSRRAKGTTIFHGPDDLPVIISTTVPMG